VTAVLEVKGLTAGYGHLAVVHDVSFGVAAGEITALLGRNGAGKTTTLLAIAGFLSDAKGDVEIHGQKITGPVYRRTAKHLGIVLEGRSVFPSLSVAKNLVVAGASVDAALELFPELQPRLGIAAGMLSGGEQQMLSLARALGRAPSVLLIDELSFGLAPIITERIYARLRIVAESTGMAVLLVEQHVHVAAAACDVALVMNEGRVVLELSGGDLAARADEVERVYLGDSMAGANEG
jgi:branched-chain amino acid transport system ATP-binding protein